MATATTLIRPVAAFSQGGIVAIDPLITKPDYDAALAGTSDLYMEGAQGAIRRYCGWHVYPVITESIVLDGSGRSVLRLKTLQLLEITAFSENGVALDPATLEWSQAGYLERRHGAFTRRLRGIRATIRHGFEDAPELQALVITIAERAKASPAGVVQEAAGAVNIRFSTFGSGAAGGVALMAHEYALLDLYQLPGSR